MSGKQLGRPGRRSAAGSGSNPARTGPNGSARPCSAMNASAVRMISSELLLALLGRGAPGRDPVAAEDRPDRLGPVPPDRGDVEAELEAGPPPVDPGDAVAEAAAGQLRTVGGGRERDPRVRMEVVDVVGVDEAVHGGVDRRCGAAGPEEAVVERADHLVLALHARVDLDEGAQPVQPEHREARLGQRAEVAAGALDPQQLDRLAGHRVDRRPWPTCCRRRSSCSAGPRRAGSTADEPSDRPPDSASPARFMLMRPSPPAGRRRAPSTIRSA